MSYTEVFGGENINPAQLSYIAYTINADIVLTWPLEAAPTDNVAADKIDIATTGLNLTVTVPRGDQASVGRRSVERI